MNDIIEIVTEIYNNLDKKQIEAYNVGPLLYTPATNDTVYQKLMDQNFGSRFSLALCLEDSIEEDAVELGEQIIADNFKKLYADIEKFSFIPPLFIRVRSPQQIPKLYTALGRSVILLRGFILPKFTSENGMTYIEEIKKINQISGHTIYMMPTLEGSELTAPTTRFAALEKLHSLLMDYKEYVLNVRVGGNDLCNIFGVRRNVDETIYDIRPVSNILNDIVSFFYEDFIISGPVWEYFEDEDFQWKKGLQAEMRLDSINGFTGKTVIHPNQIPVVAEGMKIRQQDLVDAVQILTFEHKLLQVSKSASGTRMNEIKTHGNWARKQIILANLYGVKE
ncbi:MAG: HpcH/HpaI aldolase/citrate lyase family protein [Lachnospiraceae bacterium]|nr:HpcH/HpaI aldolase/citrate lyase family protein [Lachnospiraceae bacterium]